MKKGLRRALFCAMLSPESSDMRTPHTWLLTVLALGVAWCTFPAHAQLTPAYNESAPYGFANAGPLTLTGWSVLNALDEATQNTPLNYTVASDEGGNYLDLSANPLAASEKVYLALTIAQEGATNPGIPMTSFDASVLRLDNVYAKVRFEESAIAPEFEDLRKMYLRYDQQGVDGSAVAAKVGLYVDDEGHFCVVRPSPGETGEPDSVTFDWCQTGTTYDSVGGGAVIVRIEFCTYGETVDSPATQAYRVWVRNANPDGEGAQEVCLTSGLGYSWLSGPGKGYGFDFSSLGQGDWFYAIDIAEAGTETGSANLDADSLNALNQLAFSASGGGFYSAWLDVNKPSTAITDTAALETTYQLGDFAKYAGVNATPASRTKFTEWMLRYGVNLDKYLKKTGGIQTMNAQVNATDPSDELFNDFLLDVDPEANVEHRLIVTGIVPEANGKVTLTVRGPAGCALRTAVSDSRAGRVCVTRAATLDELPNAKPENVNSALRFDDANTATLVLEGGKTPLPFMKVTLQGDELL